MTLVTYEGVVQKGSVLLSESVQLRENVKVYVIVTEEVISTKINGKKLLFKSSHRVWQNVTMRLVSK